MGNPFLAILEGLKLNFSPGASAPTMLRPPTSLIESALFKFGPLNVEELPTALNLTKKRIYLRFFPVKFVKHLKTAFF